jgi:hypothetical protein
VIAIGSLPLLLLEIERSQLMAGLTWLTAAAAFTLAEDVGDNGRVESFADTLWWSAATITYGRRNLDVRRDHCTRCSVPRRRRRLRPAQS